MHTKSLPEGFINRSNRHGILSFLSSITFYRDIKRLALAVKDYLQFVIYSFAPVPSQITDSRKLMLSAKNSKYCFPHKQTWYSVFTRFQLL